MKSVSPPLSSKSLHQVLWPFGLVAVLCTLLLAAGGVAKTGQTYDLARNNATQVRQFAAILEAANAISAERGPANVLMTAEPSRYESLLLKWHNAQARTDAALKTASLTRTLPRDLLDRVTEQLDQGRRRVLAASLRPREQLAYRDVQMAINAMFLAWDNYQRVVLWQSRHMIQSDPAIASVAIRNMTLSGLREYAGRLGSYLIAPISMKENMPLENQINSRETMARIQTLWTLLPAYVGDIGGSADRNLSLAQHYEIARQVYMVQGLALVERQLRDGGELSAMALDAESFTAQYVAAMKPLETLRNQNLAAVVDKFNHRQDQALIELLATALIATLLVGSMSVLLIVMRRRVVQPLLHGAKVIIDLSENQLPSQPMPIQGQVRELQRLYAAIDAVAGKLAEWSTLTRQFEKLAITDGLTGLVNRRNLDELGFKASLSVRSSDVPHLILVDIDHFKAINDRYGHPVGDQVLREVAALMRRTVRDNDCVARFGGEEFAVLIQGNSLAEAAIVARKLRRAVQNQTIVTSDGQALRVTASFGVAGGKNEAWADIIRYADEALYRAKTAGRNRVRVTRTQSRQRHPPLLQNIPLPELG
ncbi:diguanylate cyclase [Amphibiibacter pelophylacis]|uniref:GGDEF domain-containing protein n=1 Tax=Amphibiibacter pelophylacis TaxID=1799477 RepID=A0ACC6NYX5_9BURK